MSPEKVQENAPAASTEEKFDWADDVNEAVKSGMLPDCKTSEETTSYLLAKIEEWSQKKEYTTTGSDQSSRDANRATETTPEETKSHYFDELHAFINQTVVGFPSTKKIAPSVPCGNSEAFGDTDSSDAVFDPLIEMLEDWSFGDSKNITAKKVIATPNERAHKLNFQISNSVKKQKLTAHAKGTECDIKDRKTCENQFEDEDIATSIPLMHSTTEQTPVSEKIDHYISTDNDVYDTRESYMVALVRWFEVCPRANLPPHCERLDLSEEPVQEPMPRRPLGVPECKLLRNMDQKVAIAYANMTTCGGFIEWMELASDGIRVEEIPVTQAERRLMREKKLGHYRSKPSALRRCWTIESSIE